MICFDRDNNRFNFRIAGVAIYNNKLLLHRLEKDDFWALPGGRNEFHEFSEDTLIREMQEELNEEIKVERLLWVAEDFFEYDDKKYHELSFYYMMNFINEGSDIFDEEEFFRMEGDTKIIFRWYDLDDLSNIELYPTFIKEKVVNLSNHIEHIMHIDGQ
ncbi:NUDIX hydrolase [Vallitalea sediminicola]